MSEEEYKKALQEQCVQESLKRNNMLKTEEELKAISVFFDKRHLAEQFIKIQPVYYDTARNWWVWCKNEKRWIRTDETHILNLINSHSSADTINSKQKNEIIEALRQECRKNKPLDIKPTWIQFKDTIYDIETGEEKRANSKYFVTNPLPYELDINNYEKTPNMDRIFEEWVGKEHVRTLYEILAYCMLPSYPINRLFCFIGAGMNGKSKFLELLRKFIGDYNCASTELDTLLTSRFEVTRLHKKLVCQMGETNFNEIHNTSILKKLTGGDMIGFEYKRADLFEDINYAKIIISTNNLPETTDKTIGFYRRWLIIDFPNQFSEKKDILNEIPEEEYRCLSRKCCIILKELLHSRKFTNEGSIEERTKKYEDRSNPFEKFYKEFVEEGEGFITKNEFIKRFNSWCKSNRFREVSDTEVNRKMKEKSIFEARHQVEWFEHESRKSVFARCWEGIKWK